MARVCDVLPTFASTMTAPRSAKVVKTSVGNSSRVASAMSNASKTVTVAPISPFNVGGAKTQPNALAGVALLPPRDVFATLTASTLKTVAPISSTCACKRKTEALSSMTMPAPESSTLARRHKMRDLPLLTQVPRQ